MPDGCNKIVRSLSKRYHRRWDDSWRGVIGSGVSFRGSSHCKVADRWRCTRAFADNQDFGRLVFLATFYSQNLKFFLRPSDKGLLLCLYLVCLGYTHPRSVSFHRSSCRSLQFCEPLRRVSPNFQFSNATMSSVSQTWTRNACLHRWRDPQRPVNASRNYNAHSATL